MASKQLSLREIGRRLGIPPSSIVYYKDRFSAYIPHFGEGKRRRYPLESLDIFREIREMFDENRTAEEIEMELADRFPKRADPMSEQVSTARLTRPATPSSDLALVLDRMSALLDERQGLKQELAVIREELAAAREESDRREQELAGRVGDLEGTVIELRQEMEELHRRLSQAPEPQPRTPPESFLELPLVIRTDSNEFLGVAGRTKHFSLNEFIAVIRDNSPDFKNMSLRWNKRYDNWVLNITTLNTETGQRKVHQMEAGHCVTPSGNEVVCLTKLVIDGEKAPDSFLLVLFRKIKDGFDL